MCRLSKRVKTLDGSPGGDPSAKWITPVAAARLASTLELMGTRDQLAIPRLVGAPEGYLYSAGDSALIALARTLVELDLATPEDWESANRDPGAFVLGAIERWIAAHGGDVNRRRFDLYVTLSSYLDVYSDKNEENPDGSNLYLTVDPDRCGFVVFGPTLELLERVHPRLPATFYSIFSRGLNLWVRLYDYRDAEDRVTMLREWIEGEADEDQYEIPDVAGCIPPCMKRRPLGRTRLQELRAQIREARVVTLLDAVLDLTKISERTVRPELTEEMREELCDTNPPLPSLLMVFCRKRLRGGLFQ